MGKKHRRRTLSRKQLRFRRQSRPGANPAIVQAPIEAKPSRMHVLAYSPKQFLDKDITDLAALSGMAASHSVCWIDVAGLADVGLVKQLGEKFDLHPLAIEDVMNLHQRAKVEPYEHSLFVIARLPQLIDGHFSSQQLSIFLRGNTVLTFQEETSDWFEPVRERVRKSLERSRSIAPGFLVYALLDVVIDSYFPIVDALGDELDEIEGLMASGETRVVLGRIHQLLHELLLVRRTIRPHRDAINELIRDSSERMDAETLFFLRDCADHTIQLIELLEVYREMCIDYRDFHLSLISNRMNEVMRGLTLVATVFMPLNLIAAIYGMNFADDSPYNMPELRWRFGYPAVLGLMVCVAVLTVVWFSRRGWLRPPDPDTSDGRE
ncbi:MAG: magnesium/cobalt transporter CorA [Planctomycetales bacterium]|nr:magnesium/cobalt transporter CorA [Planctomycetales bacterium]